MSKRHVYHYCAKYQLASGAVNIIDGIALVTNKIKSQDQYRELKKLISPEHYELLSIQSLSYHGKE